MRVGENVQLYMARLRKLSVQMDREKLIDDNKQRAFYEKEPVYTLEDSDKLMNSRQFQIDVVNGLPKELAKIMHIKMIDEVGDKKYFKWDVLQNLAVNLDPHEGRKKPEARQHDEPPMKKHRVSIKESAEHFNYFDGHADASKTKGILKTSTGKKSEKTKFVCRTGKKLDKKCSHPPGKCNLCYKCGEPGHFKNKCPKK
eukprot:Nk52_evm5s361 gene=Nk52_evmTU5s361